MIENDDFRLKRGAFLAASVAAACTALPSRAFGAAPAGSAAASDSTEMLLGRLMAGNRRFISNDFPPASHLADKRAMLLESQAPYAAILGCCDSRVIPELVFVQGIGELFVARVAGNFPDGALIGSLEYTVSQLGTRLVMVLGHEGCGAVKAVYKAMATSTPLPSHLSVLEDLISPGIASVVRAKGSIAEAIEANVRAAIARLTASPPVFASGVASGRVRVVGGIYELKSGAVRLLG